MLEQIKKIPEIISIYFSHLTHNIKVYFFLKKVGYADTSVNISIPKVCTCPRKVYLYENTNIYSGAKFIISPKGSEGKFILKKNSGIAQDFTVITGNHGRSVGTLFKSLSRRRGEDEDKDVVIDEDVWIGANVTICSGVTIGRGATVGAGSVVRQSLPPYSISFGNPAKVIGFCFTPKEIILHEATLYPVEERLPLEILEKNYQKYFLKRIKEIKEYTKL